HEPSDGGPPISVFESGAIMIYLAEKAGRFYPRDTRARTEVNQWVMWQMANQGPKTGEAGHFRRLGDSQGDQSYAVRRFTDEVNRLYGVLKNRLYDRRFIAGDEYTIADMISYPWTVGWEQQGQATNEFGFFTGGGGPPAGARRHGGRIRPHRRFRKALGGGDRTPAPPAL